MIVTEAHTHTNKQTEYQQQQHFLLKLLVFLDEMIKIIALASFSNYFMFSPLRDMMMMIGQQIRKIEPPQQLHC